MAVTPVLFGRHIARREEPELRIINADKTNDSLPEVNVYDIFVENAPQKYNIPGAPRFAIEGKNRKFYLGIGGTVKTTVSYDFGHPIDNSVDFITSSIPMTIRKGDGGKVQFSAQTSSIFLNLVAMPGTGNQLGAYVNFNLTGNNYLPELQFAYLKYRGIIAGYNYSLFSDMAAAPPSIDNEGPNAFTATQNALVDYTHSFGKNKQWEAGVGLEMPIASSTDGAKCYQVSQRIPDIPAYIQYSFAPDNYIRFSAIMRNMYYHDMITDKNRDKPGWGIKLSGIYTPAPLLNIYYQAAYGTGIASYFQDLYDGGLDMVPSATPGKMDAVKAWGGYIGLQYNLTKNIFATTTYSHLRNYANKYTDGATPWPQQYRYAQYALANVMWQITPMVQTGIEYIYGRRVDMSNQQAHDSRIQMMLMVSF